MSDVFLSYKAEDRPRLRQLVAALEADGLSLWWDAQIEGGATWHQSIQEQLDAARCVVVVWSKLAYRSADPGLGQLRGDPFIDPIRGDPRFKALVERLHLP